MTCQTRVTGKGRATSQQTGRILIVERAPQAAAGEVYCMLQGGISAHSGKSDHVPVGHYAWSRCVEGRENAARINSPTGGSTLSRSSVKRRPSLYSTAISTARRFDLRISPTLSTKTLTFFPLHFRHPAVHPIPPLRHPQARHPHHPLHVRVRMEPIDGAVLWE